MAGLTKRSDRATAAAGSVAVPERTRTAALATAVVVPLAAALLWYVAALIAYHVNPPSPATVPFGPIGDGYVFVVMFALGVVPAVSGPILGLVIARWLPRRGVTALAVVLVVLVTIVMQGNFQSTWHWRVVWPWTYWYGPVGWNTGTGHWAALPGSPQVWVVYLLAVCALGVLAAIYHDPESDRAMLRKVIAGVVVAGVVALALTMTLGLEQAVYNPVTGPDA
jgi:ABC-type phosphate transport system permease subunit